ncbi:MAG: Uma2 family endonuclease [Ktedonobacteraceae bacterium]
MAQRRFDDQETPLSGTAMHKNHFAQWINDPDAPRTGIPISEADFERLVSDETEFRYELIGGLLYNMTGSSPEHADLAGQIESSFRLQLGRSGPCRSYQEQYVAIPGHTPLCPDVVITCAASDRDKNKRSKPFRIQSPRLIVEILSPSTEKRDRGYKFAHYQTCPTLEVYMLASQYEPRIEVYRLANDWQQEVFSAGQTINLDQLNLKMHIDEIYEGVF